MVTWSYLGCPFTSPNLDILGVKFDSRLTFEDHVRGIVSRYYAFVLPILEYCSPVCMGVCCGMSSSASLTPGVFGGLAYLIRLSCRCIIDVMLLRICAVNVVRG